VTTPPCHRVLDQGLVHRQAVVPVMLKQRNPEHGAALRPPIRSAVCVPETHRTHLVRLGLVNDLGHGREVSQLIPVGEQSAVSHEQP